jgi:hypothetical protein
LSFYQYAAYGSNLHPQRLQRRVPSAKLLGTEFLPGHRLTFHKRSSIDGSGKCSIFEGGSGVYVAIYEIAEAERALLDACEGVGVGYNRHDVCLHEFGACSTYVARLSAIDESLRPTDWYKEYVLRGARYHRFPNAYVEDIERQVVIADSDDNRAAAEWALVQQLDGCT